MIAKSTTIKGWGGKSGGRAVKAVGLTSGGLRRVPETGLKLLQGGLIAAQKSAEGIVGGEYPLKARTVERPVERRSRECQAAEGSGRTDLGNRSGG